MQIIYHLLIFQLFQITCSCYLNNLHLTPSILPLTSDCTTSTSTSTSIKNTLTSTTNILKDSQVIQYSLSLGLKCRNIIQLIKSKQLFIHLPYQQLYHILDPIDVTFLICFTCFSKSLLHSFYYLFHQIIFKKTKVEYKNSLFGYIEQPIQLISYFLPILYCFDIINILLTHFHIIPLSKINNYDIMNILHSFSFTIIIGTFITKMKDWLVNEIFHLHVNTTTNNEMNNNNTGNTNKTSTFNELSSIFIWSLVILTTLEKLSKIYGFGLGSVFALGGVGSASIILALRSTFENFSGGILLKIQDKFRLNELIELQSGIKGYVTHMTYLTTTIRRQDESLITIPNHTFTHGQLINWSRTKYRKLKLSSVVSLKKHESLTHITQVLHDKLSQLKEIETNERDLIICAKPHQDGISMIEVDGYLVNMSEKELAILQTKVTQILGDVLHK